MTERRGQNQHHRKDDCDICQHSVADQIVDINTRLDEADKNRVTKEMFQKHADDEMEAMRRAVKEAAEEGAAAGVKKTFAILGVDIENPSQVEDFRQDLRFSKDLRAMVGKGKMAMVTAVVLMFMGALGLGVTQMINGPK